MKHPDSVYYTEGVSGQRKFTFEVFREADGSYRAVAARWNARLNKVDEQTQFTAPDKAGLREQPYPSTRQVKIFLTLNSGTTAMYDVITEVPTSEQMTEVRERTGLTQTELGKIIGINLRNYQLRETGDRSTNPGEYNLLMLLADNHPLYRIKGYTPEKDAAGIAEKLLLAEPDAAEVRRLRIAMGLKQKEVAERFGYTLGAWRSKEMASKRGTLRQAEYNFMLLLLDEHPTLKLTARKASQAN